MSKARSRLPPSFSMTVGTRAMSWGWYLYLVRRGTTKRARRASPRAALSAAAFFEALPLTVSPRLPIELRGFETLRGRGRLLKFHYGVPQAHFEAWHHFGA